MKKMLAALVIFILLLITAAGEASFLILLKNGGRLTTPMYWIEGRMILFYYAGGIAGMERKDVERVEKYEEQTGVFGPQVAGTTALPPPRPTEETPGPGAPPDTKERRKDSPEKQGEDLLKKQLQEELRNLQAESTEAWEIYQKISEQDTVSQVERDEARNRVFTIDLKKQELIRRLQEKNQK